ncbi:Dyp-type peroxidase (plasmid) [Halorussus limi]|uniref:Dyp-type peroxidase n=1 Tax=Halorussus limi TaxID=2938695 RepID=A0A8U0I039_9EURY|nr:Dyp-type peroxidase [Halorussus limi]UPV76547.1 Dyp-type peroxidase [Halorussus limi]
MENTGPSEPGASESGPSDPEARELGGSDAGERDPGPSEASGRDAGRGGERGISRRQFAKAAVAIGGASALSACMSRSDDLDVKTGPDDLSTLPARQHAWDEFLNRDQHGNVVAPRHRVLLLLNYAGDGAPSDADRKTAEAAFRSLERAYRRGNDGLLFTVGYSPSYFGRFDAELPDTVDLREPKALAPFEDPEFDCQDAVVHLASDHAEVVLAAEQALIGEKTTVNGVEMAADLSGIFERADRRTGFVGEGLPADHQDVDGIPDSKPVSDDAPLYMGFKSGFQKNQASEDRVTIREGPFAGGTTHQLSKIELNLEQWYQQDSRSQRVGKMFCPVHAEEGLVEGAGDNLGDSAKMEEKGCPAHAEDHARTKGVVGHSQKSARARDDDGSPLMIRRDFDSTDDGQAGLHFVSLQRTISDFVDTRDAMNGEDLAERSAVGQTNNNGILQYMEVLRRGNFLLPPRKHRSLPTPNPV